MTTVDEAHSSLDPSVGAALGTSAGQGIAVLDVARRCLWINEPGARLLAGAPGELVGRHLTVPAHARFTWTESPISVNGEDLLLALFHEGDRHDRYRRKVAAFARTAARVALVGSVEDVLDRVAEEAREATGARACSIVLRDGDGFDANRVGIAGHEPSYLARLLTGLHEGAPLATLEAFQTGRPARRSQLQQLRGSGTGYGALLDSAVAAGWNDLIAVPMVVKDETLGVLTCFFGEEQSPLDEDVAFLLAMADQCGVAVHVSRLFGEMQAVAAAEQRHRWAHDLHDSVSQSLFSLVLQTRALRLVARRAGQSDDGADGDRLERGLLRLESMAEGMQAEMRSLMTELRPGFEGEPLLPAVARLAAEIREQTDLDVVVDLPREEPDVTDFVRAELFRVAREAVHNSVRHARGDRLWIRLWIGAEQDVVLEVADDGRGFDASRPNPGHLGLWSMRERAQRLGGTCFVVSSAAGTRVRVAVPIRRDPAASRSVDDRRR